MPAMLYLSARKHRAQGRSTGASLIAQTERTCTRSMR